MPYKNITFVGAHPDDIEIGCLGTVMNHLSDKDNVTCVIASDGEVGRVYSYKFDRLEESLKCLIGAGVKRDNIIFMHLPDTKTYEHRRPLFDSIEKILADKNIDRVYMHTYKDYHQDHVTIYEEAMRASRDVPDVLTFESNSSTLPTFSPTYFVDIGAFLDKKMNLLKNHKSQKHRTYMNINSLKALATVRGYQSRRFNYAEAYEVQRCVEGSKK